jgi:murein DD-endopeptidase MepM/ murein hydrolase activator NlpD
VPDHEPESLAYPEPEPESGPQSYPARAAAPQRGRHRAADRPGRPAPYVAAALVGIAGLAIVGTAVATAGGDRSGPARTVTVATDASLRAEAAERADRAHRSPLPTATADAARPSAADATRSTQAPGSAEATAATKAPVSAEAAPSRGSTAASASPSTAPTARPTTSAPAAKPTTSSAPATVAPASADWVHPMPGASVTSCYGQRWGTLHAGIDLAMPANTPIRAAAAGTVVEAGWVYSGYGISVVIDHGDGWLTHYAHMNSTAVGVGTKVASGDVIGYEGSTGDSTGPHLHFEVHNGLWNQVDPAPWMRQRGVELGC